MSNTIHKMLSSTIHQQKIYGLLCVILVALVSYAIATLPLIAQTGISSLVVAILLGALCGNLWQHPASWHPGIQFAAKKILRLAIILYGFRISFQDIASLGTHAILLDCFIVSFTIGIGYFIGTKIFKLDRDLSLLISTGAAICGAAAVLAVEDILKNENYKTVIAVGTVVLFGTIAMFLYPALQHYPWFALSENQFGMFTGGSIHEVAQALVAGSSVSVAAGKVAVIVKMMRVLLLVPVLFILAFWHPSSSQKRINIPWFAVWFVIVICINSLHLLPADLVELINEADIILLTMAMAAIGIETKFAQIKHVGLPPLYLATVLFLWLMVSSYTIVRFVF